MIDIISQIGIALFGVIGVALSQTKEPSKRKWASIFGLCAQPFWFYSAYTTKQWGMFFVCFLYASSYLYGFYNNWIKNEN